MEMEIHALQIWICRLKSELQRQETAALIAATDVKLAKLARFHWLLG